MVTRGGGVGGGGVGGGGYEDDGQPRREFSRSVSSDNWREAKRDEEEDGGGWRKMNSKDRWRQSLTSHLIVVIKCPLPITNKTPTKKTNISSLHKAL